jgi:heme-degrading monooxygenase HmoA
MWAQLVRARIKSGSEDQLRALDEEFAARGQDGSTGWERTIVLRNQDDPQERLILVFFESEEKARENERSPRQQELLGRVQQLYDGQPEFVNLIPEVEHSRQR